VQFHHAVPEADDGSAEVGKDYSHMSADLQVIVCFFSSGLFFCTFAWSPVCESVWLSACMPIV
jgi:hypothetical protein